MEKHQIASAFDGVPSLDVIWPFTSHMHIEIWVNTMKRTEHSCFRPAHPLIFYRCRFILLQPLYASHFIVSGKKKCLFSQARRASAQASNTAAPTVEAEPQKESLPADKAEVGQPVTAEETQNLLAGKQESALEAADSEALDVKPVSQVLLL